ncbi:hypothetical protein RchiOBHm_Chr6g0265751 [Rosa chinensis]|uniref:Uncharacterized protein n=1 Tax=Rosa chinensis TaxID=74649 RepID=A0A2P6PPH6_ROSCH|nr:hypothetical protein RchiOBHm_Chr6g0265751 [Rosa chinensis]
MEEKSGRVGLSVSKYLKPETEPKIYIRVGLRTESRFSILKPNRIGLFCSVRVGSSVFGVRTPTPSQDSGTL